MMRTVAGAVAALLILAGGTTPVSAQSPGAGRWAVTTRAGDPAHVQMRLEYSESSTGNTYESSWSTPVPVADAGISLERLRGPIGPVSFTFAREPGTFACTGSAGEGSGAGQFTYAPNPRFDDTLNARGLGRPTYRQSLELALSGATLSFIDQLRETAQHATVADVVRALQHGVSPTYVAELRGLGYRVVTLDQLVRMRDHGVTTAMVRAVQAAGYRNLSPEDLARLADHGVREQYIGEMRAAGYAQVTADQLVTMRDHGVSPRYVADLAAAGYHNLSADDLVALRDHGVSAAYVERLRSHGYVNVPVRDLIRLRDSGI